jgi:ELWxxDGT repeat protein
MASGSRALRCAVLAVVFATLTAASVAATFRPATLVRDIETTIVPVGSHPRLLCTRNGYSTLLTTDDSGDSRIWRTDGTTANTQLISDLGALEQGSDLWCISAGTSGAQYLIRADGNHFNLVAIDASAGTMVNVYQSDYALTYLGTAGVPIFGIVRPDGSTQLLRSDGTAAGTSVFASVATSINEYIAMESGTSFEMGGRIFFGVGSSLWESNGTGAGTHPVIALTPAGGADQGIYGFQPLGNRFLFTRQLAADIAQLWISDGTAGGSQLLATFDGNQSLTAVDSLSALSSALAVFVVSNLDTGDGTLWRTDGSVSGTVPVSAGAPDLNVSSTSQMVRVNGGVVFAARSATYGLEPWFSDGTDAGTHLLREFVAGSGDSDLIFLKAGAGAMLMRPPTGMNVLDLWFTDGTMPGTWSLNASDSRLSEPQSDFFGFVSLGQNYLFLTRTCPSVINCAYRLWRVDSAAHSVALLKQFSAPYDTDVDLQASLFNTGLVNGRGIFAMYDAVMGVEPWSTDGTSSGTVQLADLAPQVSNSGSAPQPFASLNGAELFLVFDQSHGPSLWRTDGTATGTSLVSDAVPFVAFGSNQPPPSLQRGGTLFYPAQERDGTIGLWRTDGTTGGTTRIQAFSGINNNGRGPASCGAGFVSSGNTFYFGVSPNGVNRLFRSDGTSGGTTDLGSYPDTSIGSGPVCVLAAFGGEIYFTAMDSTTNRPVLWRSNGLAGSQSVVMSGQNAFFSVTVMNQLGNSLYFTGQLGGVWGLYRIDSTGATPTLVVSHTGQSVPIRPGVLEALDSTLIYPVCDAIACHLARSDGTANGSFVLINTTISPFFNRWAYFNYNGKLLFQAADTDTGIELWTSDGTLTGTHLLKDILPGTEKSKPRDFVNFNGLVYFRIDVTQNGTIDYPQLWRTDGTEAGTERANVTPMFYGTTQNNGIPGVIDPPFGVAGDHLYFGGFEPATETELWQIENEAPAAAADTASSAGTLVTINVLANDSDPDGTLAPASVRIAQAPANGSATIDTAGSLRYTPNAGFSGTEQFTYQVADRQGRFSAPASVSVTVTTASSTGGGGGSGGGGSGTSGSGGGGSLEPLSLLCLAGLIHLATRRRRHATTVRLG